jgi:hypothetical protein
MSKTQKIMIALAVAGLLTTGAIAYAADGSTDQSQSPKQTMMQGAVEKGIISQDQADQLQTYNKETMKQRHEEMMQNRIDKAVEDGTITQDEANQIKAWQDSRPAAMDKLGGPDGKGMGMHKMD